MNRSAKEKINSVYEKVTPRNKIPHKCYECKSNERIMISSRGVEIITMKHPPEG